MAKSFQDIVQPTLDAVAKLLAEKLAQIPVPAESPPVTTTLPQTSEPRWLVRGRKEIGTKEIKGPKHSNAVLGYGIDARVPDTSSDEIPWCAWFVGAMLEREGIRGTHSALARSYEQKGWGVSLPKDELRPGAIAVLNRPGGAAWQGHVGIVVGSNDTHVFLLGGNQNNQVSIAPFAKSRIVAVKWPANEPIVGPKSVFMTSKDLKAVSDR